ncbi:glycosyltransferase [Psychrobacter sp. NG25]|uniref:glycosyltransferase n=1 Tax=Psychrobacter sp. NG25 TaxID=2782005 RepID=UPI001883ED0A|nr:glycosyltransferase [Psychrobacter sp. NG25]MBF0657475.1 glycosyltransferase [Psychrobacter sp. NG25]
MIKNKLVVVLVSNDCEYDNRVQKTVKALCSNGYMVILNTVYKKKNIKLSFLDVEQFSIESKFWNPSSSTDKLLKLIPKKIKKKVKPSFLKYYRYLSYTNLWKNEAYPELLEVIIANDLITLPVGVLLKKKHPNSKLVYDSHEYELHRMPPLTKMNKLFVRILEGFCIRYCDDIITCSHYIADEMQQIYGTYPISCIYNSPSRDKLPIGKNPLRDDLKLESDSIILLHVGKLTYGRGIEVIVRYLKDLPNVHLVNLGGWDNTFKANIDSVIDNLHVKNQVHFLEPVPPNNVVDYIKGVDIGIISIESMTKSYEYSMPNKLFEMSFAKIPIMVNKDLKCASLVKEYNFGIEFDIYNFDNFKETIKSILENKESFYNQKSFDDFTRIYSLETQESKLINIVNTLTYIK